MKRAGHRKISTSHMESASSAATPTHDSLAPTLTFGAGMNRPVGRLETVSPGPSLAQSVAKDLGETRSAVEGWVSLNRWRGNHRTGENWESAIGSVVDLDFHDGTGKHAKTPPKAAAALAKAAAAGTLPGNLFHPTPRGARFMLLFDHAETDPERMKAANRGAAALVDEALKKIRLAAKVHKGKARKGFAVDRTALDLARVVFTPNAVVERGKARDAAVLVMREDLYAVSDLMQHGQHPAIIAPTTDAGDAETFKQAVARWNADHPSDWPRNPATCPACGHNACFHALPTRLGNWFCFSSNHGPSSGGCGRESEVGWFGDALDLEAHRSGVPPIEVLRRDGYLGDGKPEILITTDIECVVNATERALIALPGPVVFQRGTDLVHVLRDGAPKVRGWDRPPNAPVIARIEDARLRELAAKGASWIKLLSKGKRVPALPPNWVAETLRARGEWAFPPLEGVVETPTLRADGTIIDEPGYDPASGLLYLPGNSTFPRIPSRPTLAAARRALEVLAEPFEEFPYLSLADRSAIFAAILSVLARRAFSGPVPLFALRASTPGSGKTLQVDVISLIVTGRVAARMAPTDNEEEMRKRIHAIALEGAATILLDNVSGAFGSNTISAALTAEIWEDRKLGITASRKAPLRAVWFLTGNNVTFKGDLPRRVITCDIDPKEEHPEDRDGFKQSDLHAFVRERRGELVVAALTLLRSYFVAGRPPHRKPPMGSYGGWDALVRGALIWAGAPDPLETRERIREDGDSELDALRTLLGEWLQAFGHTPQTSAAVVGKSLTTMSLRDALTELTGKDMGRLETAPFHLTNSLKAVRDRIANGLRFRSDKKRGRPTMWWVQGTPPPDKRSGSLGLQEAGGH